MNARSARVGYDVTALLAGDTGVARYVHELGAALDRRGVDLVRFAIGRGEHRDAVPRGTRCLRVPLRVVQRSWSLSGALSVERLAPGCDVVHVPDLVPGPTRRPLVVTVHDTVALEHPSLHPPRSVAAQRAQVEAARDRAAVVLAVSESTKRALCARGVDERRIVVTPNGASALPAPDRRIVPAAPYFLAVGSITPRKNLPLLAAAFARVAPGRDVKLVIAGGSGWDASRVVDDIAQCGGGRVWYTGRVSDAQLAALYESCVAVCIPSIAEGFGLPVVEAAAAGAPVIASDLPVFREIDGPVTQFAPARDVDAWAAALERALDDGDLRRAARARARDVAHTYTWDRTATATLDAYTQALEAA